MHKTKRQGGLYTCNLLENLGIFIVIQSEVGSVITLVSSHFFLSDPSF